LIAVGCNSFVIVAFAPAMSRPDDEALPPDDGVEPPFVFYELPHAASAVTTAATTATAASPDFLRIIGIPFLTVGAR
jgi:hypothetical protein